LSFFTGGLQIGILVATTFLVFCNNYMFTFGVALTAPGFVTIGTAPCSSFSTLKLNWASPDWYLPDWVARAREHVGHPCLGHRGSIRARCGFPSAQDRYVQRHHKRTQR